MKVTDPDSGLVYDCRNEGRRNEGGVRLSHQVVLKGHFSDANFIAGAWCLDCGLPAVPVPGVDSETGRKLDAGKLRYGLIDWSAMAWLAGSLTYGSIKYSPENWRLVPDARTRYYDALMRHMEAFRAGEDYDEESGLPHLANAMFCVMCLTSLFAPRDLKVVMEKTNEAIRRWRATASAKVTSASV